MKRVLAFAYGVTCYGIFFATFLYAVGWVGGFGVPKTIDGEPTQPLGIAIAVNSALLMVFALQHSVMARPAFKRWWTKFVAEPVERSTYVLFSSVALIAVSRFRGSFMASKMRNTSTPFTAQRSTNLRTRSSA